MLTWGGQQKLTFADGGRGGVQNGLKNADVINEQPLIGMKEMEIFKRNKFVFVTPFLL